MAVSSFFEDSKNLKVPRILYILTMLFFIFFHFSTWNAKLRSLSFSCFKGSVIQHVHSHILKTSTLSPYPILFPPQQTGCIFLLVFTYYLHCNSVLRIQQQNFSCWTLGIPPAVALTPIDHWFNVELLPNVLSGTNRYVLVEFQ